MMEVMLLKKRTSGRGSDSQRPSEEWSAFDGRPKCKPGHIPNHEVLRCIGEGSYGQVWLARSVFGNYLAIKFVFRDGFSNRLPFDREWCAVRKFTRGWFGQHGCLKVLFVGTDKERGFFYYGMELADDIEGRAFDPSTYQPRTLSNVIEAQGRLPVRECVQLGLSLSAGLRSLHSIGLVHRDVKPSNILFVRGRPQLADVGLVTDIRMETRPGGSPGYSPPEGVGTVQADIFGLGKVLYEAATGQDRMDFPALPIELLNCPRARELLRLNEVILKACESDPKLRYRSAEQLKSELLRLNSPNAGELSRLNEVIFKASESHPRLRGKSSIVRHHGPLRLCVLQPLRRTRRFWEFCAQLNKFLRLCVSFRLTQFSNKTVRNDTASPWLLKSHSGKCPDIPYDRAPARARLRLGSPASRSPVDSVPTRASLVRMVTVRALFMRRFGQSQLCEIATRMPNPALPTSHQPAVCNSECGSANAQPEHYSVPEGPQLSANPTKIWSPQLPQQLRM